MRRTFGRKCQDPFDFVQEMLGEEAFGDVTAVATDQLGPAQLVWQDSGAGRLPRRFYRIERIRAPVGSGRGVALCALTGARNSVFLAGEAFHALEIAPSGQLALIVWHGADLEYWERRSDSNWDAAGVCGGGSLFQSVGQTEIAFLGLKRATVWGAEAWPRLVASNSHLVF